MKKEEVTKIKAKIDARGRSSTAGKASVQKTPPTTPFAIFERSMDRAQNLLTIHETAHGKASRPPLLLADVCRASLVLSVSALDAYIRTLVINMALKMLKDIGKSLPLKLKDQIKQLLSSDQLLDAARSADLPTRVEKALTDKFEYSSFQGVRNIEEAMRLIGYDDIFKNIARSASLNEQELKEDLARFTKQRHIIAHCGDYDLSQVPPAENPISKKQAEDCIKLMRKIAQEINKIVTT